MEYLLRNQIQSKDGSNQSFDTANQRFSELVAVQNFSAILLAIQISGN